MFFVENGVFAFLRHKLDIQIMFVFFLDVFDHLSGDTLSVVRRAHENIVHAGEHFAVVDDADESDKLIAVISRSCFQYNGKAEEKQAAMKIISNS